MDAQADLSLRWAHSYFVGFVMRRLTFTFQLCFLARTFSSILFNFLAGVLAIFSVEFFVIIYVPGADPGFSVQGSVIAMGGSIWSIYPIFSKSPMKMK